MRKKTFGMKKIPRKKCEERPKLPIFSDQSEKGGHLHSSDEEEGDYELCFGTLVKK